MNVKQHPLMEVIARKLSGIESVPRKAQARMVLAACRAARKWHEAEIERLQEELNRWTGVFAGITPENMRQRMSDLSIANARLTARVAELTAELDDYCRADANINYALNKGDRNINHETAQP